MKKLLVFSALALAFAASPALADHHEGHKKGGMFEKADVNGDGVVSKEEFMKSQEERFSKMDANGDGSFTKDEAEAMKKKWAEKRKERKEQRLKERSENKPGEEHTTPIEPAKE